MFCDSHKPGLLSWELYLAAVPSSSLSHLCLTEVVLFSISLPRTYNCSFYFCYSLLSSINSCSLRIFWVPPEMSTLVWHCPFLWEMWSILLCYGCDYRSWIHTWTPFLTCITPRKFESDFHFKFTFVFPFQTVSWFLCSFVLNMFQFIIFPCLSTCWLSWEASWGSGLWLCLCTLSSGISPNAPCERANQAWEQTPATHALNLGCDHVCVHITGGPASDASSSVCFCLS